jgi:hypothetical protein
VLAAQDALKLEASQGGFELIELLPRFDRSIGITLRGKLQVELRLFQLFELLAPRRNRLAQLRPLPEQRLGFGRVAPEVGRGCNLIQLANACFPLGDVKETSRTPLAVSRPRTHVLSAR